MWFPRLASDRALRICPTEAPFALTLRQNNTERLHCLNARAEALGLHRGMSFADARAYCPDLVSRPASPAHEARFLARRHLQITLAPRPASAPRDRRARSA